MRHDLHVPRAEVTCYQKALYCAGTSVAHCCSILHKILNCNIKVFKAAMKDYLSADSCCTVEEFLPQERSK